MTTEINLEGAILLRDAIVITAINDYKKILMKNQLEEKKSTIVEIENFFRSVYFSKITYMNGEEILSSLKKSFKNRKNLKSRRVKNGSQ